MVNNAIISYLLNHLGYIDSTTTISFHHNLLFPSIPSDPQFVPLAGSSLSQILSLYPSNSPIIHSYKQLKDILTWNIYVHQNVMYSQLHSEEENAMPFVCFMGDWIVIARVVVIFFWKETMEQVKQVFYIKFFRNLICLVSLEWIWLLK